MLLSEGFLSFKLASQYLDEKKIHVSRVFVSGQGSILQQPPTYFAALALPHFTILSTWSGSQVSKSTDFTVAGDIKKA